MPFFFGCVMLHAAQLSMDEKGRMVTQGSDMRVFRGEAATPLFGSVSRDHGVVRFAPALPFATGESYKVEFRQLDGTWNTQRIRLETPKAPVPEVSLTPSPAVLPANALKVYLHFTQPMEQGVFLDRITLLRQDGSVVTGAFRETELWSPDGRRLTLWLHPGRQKTGVNLNTNEGLVLREGARHVLKIAADWRSAAGVPLGREFHHDIEAGAADHTCPAPQRWKVVPPKAGTRERLTITFDKPLDPAMLTTALTVHQGLDRLAGTIHVASDAASWSFTPFRAWSAASHVLKIDPLLEDLAGNNLLHPFEVDRDQPMPPAKLPMVEFHVR
jgi:hypothetical protein